MFEIMLVDDHPIVREGITKILNKERHLSVSSSVGTISDMFTQLETQHPELILLDLKLNDGDGISTAVQLKKMFPKIKIVILSGYIEPYLAIEAKRIGVEGYILKTIASRELILSIEKVLNGEKVYDEKVEVLDNQACAVSLRKLSNQEHHLIRLLSLGKTSKEISHLMKIAEKTVRNYTSRLYRKLNVTNRSEAVAYYMRHCYIESK